MDGNVERIISIEYCPTWILRFIDMNGWFKIPCSFNIHLFLDLFQANTIVIVGSHYGADEISKCFP